MTPQLLEARLDALYRRDARGRLVESNEWEARPAPRFHLMRTPHGAWARFRADVSEACAAELEVLARTEAWELSARVPAHADRYAARLGADPPVEATWAGPVYVCSRDPPADGETLAIGPSNADRLRFRFPSWVGDVPHRQPFLASIQDGEVVSICASVRISDAVHCAGVETHAAFRRRGHAAAAVAAWARAVRARGATPFYSTRWDNIASQGVANRLGFALAALDFHLT